MYLRKNGSAETDTEKLPRIGSYYTNLGSGLILGISDSAFVACDSDGLIEYYVSNAAGVAYLTVHGFWL